MLPWPRQYWLFVSSFLLILLALITVSVFFGATQAFDAGLALEINSTSFGPALTSFMVVASQYGREYFWIPVVSIMLIAGKRDTKLLALELAIVFLAGIAVGEGLKDLVLRPRPFETVAGIVTRVPLASDSSYPSGHVVIVSIGAAFFLLKVRRSVALPMAFEAAAVSYSRVYVGMHYPTDVVSGILLGVVIVIVVIPLLEGYSGKQLAKVASALDRLLPLRVL